jgi:hypothetical protein
MFSNITRKIAVTIRQTIRLIKKMTMNKEFMLSIFAFILTTGSIFAQSFDKKSIASDLEFLRQSLEQTHYDLYAYTTEQAFDEVYQEVKGSIAQDSLSLLEATSLFQRLISAVNNGHTEISFPGQSYAEYAYAGVNGSTAARGVMPDIFIKDHLLDENDEILEGVLAKISEKR